MQLLTILSWYLIFAFIKIKIHTIKKKLKLITLRKIYNIIISVNSNVDISFFAVVIM